MFPSDGVVNCHVEPVLAGQEKEALRVGRVTGLHPFRNPREVDRLMKLPDAAVVVVELHEHEELALAPAFGQFGSVHFDFDPRREALIIRQLGRGDARRPVDMRLFRLREPCFKGQRGKDGIGRSAGRE